MSTPKVYLLDIEGTVAPLTLTGEVLFPYARRHVGEFLAQHAEDSSVRRDIELLAEENRVDAEVQRTGGGEMEEPTRYLLWLMDWDRKSTALKSLQGKIWKAGFESGELKGTLFEDVPEALARWARDARVAIYSSGSVEAQKLLFRYSNFGDLTGLISGYFDTRVGAKRESGSYAAIAAELKAASGEVLFFSDVVAELDAAREAGCRTRLVVRPGNAPVADTHGHDAISSFNRE